MHCFFFCKRRVTARYNSWVNGFIASFHSRRGLRPFFNEKFNISRHRQQNPSTAVYLHTSSWFQPKTQPIDIYAGKIQSHNSRRNKCTALSQIRFHAYVISITIVMRRDTRARMRTQFFARRETLWMVFAKWNRMSYGAARRPTRAPYILIQRRSRAGDREIFTRWTWEGIFLSFFFCLRGMMVAGFQGCDICLRVPRIFIVGIGYGVVWRELVSEIGVD